jgi:site-specific DNA-methyltransferase (adenine-specific)
MDAETRGTARGRGDGGAVGWLPLDEVVCVDCLDGMARMPERSVDVIVTSPPYNIGKDYLRYDDSRPREDYLSWMGSVFAACRRVLRDDGSFFLNVGGKPSDQWVPMDLAMRAREHFHLQNTIVWVKSIAIPKAHVGKAVGLPRDLAVGHYKPVNSARYLSSCHESVFHLTKGGASVLDKRAVGVPYQDKSNVRRWRAGADDVRDRGNVWFLPYKTIQAYRGHPSVFPSELPEMCIRLHGVRPRTIVLDPFMGTGSTAAAAVRLGVRFVGFELDPAYVAMAGERLARLRSAMARSR